MLIGLKWLVLLPSCAFHAPPFLLSGIPPCLLQLSYLCNYITLAHHAEYAHWSLGRPCRCTTTSYTFLLYALLVPSPFSVNIPIHCQSGPRQYHENARGGEKRDVRHSSTVVVWCVIEPQCSETKEQLLTHSRTRTQSGSWSAIIHKGFMCVSLSVLQLARNSRSHNDSHLALFVANFIVSLMHS